MGCQVPHRQRSRQAVSIQASGLKWRSDRILGLAEIKHNDPPKNSVLATMTGYSALYSALDAESTRDEPMREAGCVCLDGINQTGNEPRLPGFKVDHLVWRLQFFSCLRSTRWGFHF
jgi:hypothetical protein